MNEGALVPRALEADLTIGQAVELLRRPTGLSARALSLAAGLSESYVGKMEKGELDPSLKAFACIARELHLKPSEVHVLVVNAAQPVAQESAA